MRSSARSPRPRSIRGRLFLLSAFVDSGRSAASTRLASSVFSSGESVPDGNGSAPPTWLATAVNVRSPLPTASRTAREWVASGNSP